MTEEAVLGTVAVLRRYPVKSMLGEDLPGCEVTRSGLTGDRVLGLVHRKTGKVASAKNPRLWRDLLRLHASFSGPAVQVTFPGGAVLMASAGPGIDAALSEFLDQPVTLAATPPPDATLDRAVPEEVLRNGVRATVSVEVSHIGGAAPGGNFVDFAPLHLLTTSTLDRIGALSPRGTVELERYRPNIVIRTGTPGFAENDWADCDLRVGPERRHPGHRAHSPLRHSHAGARRAAARCSRAAGARRAQQDQRHGGLWPAALRRRLRPGARARPGQPRRHRAAGLSRAMS